MCSLLIHLVAIAFVTTAYATDPADVIVYGPHVPATLTDGTVPDHNGFYDQLTRIVIEPVAGMDHPRGTSGWAQATWGKFVVTSNYEEGGTSVGQNVADQRVGVFNSETKQFCQIDINPVVDPLGPTNASVQMLAAAHPENPTTTRIYFGGIGGGDNGATPDDESRGAAVFGFIVADVNRDPCQPYNPLTTAGWRVVRYSAKELNDATPAGFVKPCLAPGQTLHGCVWDGMALLDPETVVLGQYFLQNLVTVRVLEGSDALSVVDVYPMPLFKPANAGGACFSMRPVKNPGVDPMSPATDRRFAWGFDTGCNTPVNPTNPPGCTPWVGVCPLSGASCTAQGGCPGSFCQNTGQPCVTNAQCFLAGCVGACQLVHPYQRCSTSGQACFSSPLLNIDTCVHSPGSGFCECNYVQFGAPIQEFTLNLTAELHTPEARIHPTSPMFQTEANGGNRSLGVYDHMGGLWVSSNDAPALEIVVYRKRSDDEHTYFDPTGTKGAVSEIRLPATTPPGQTPTVFDDQVLPHSGVPIWHRVLSGAQANGGAMHAFSLANSVQRVQLINGIWQSEATSSYERHFGLTLPSEPTGGATCTNPALDVHLPAIPWFVSMGGSPTSLWMNPHFGDPCRRQTIKNAYLIRVPVATAMANNITAARPSIAWSGNRLWMVAEQGGVLQYRTRDNGFWSDWAALPANTPTLLGATIAFMSSSNTIEVFARGTDGMIYTNTLQSPINCAVGSCNWQSTWSVIPSTPITDQEPAVAYQGTAYPYLIVRRASDGKLFRILRFWGAWLTPWTEVPGITTDAAPSMAWHPTEALFWITARDATNGSIRYAKFNPATGTVGSWSTVGPTGQAWGTAPAIVWDGDHMRVFVGEAAFPQGTYQSLHNGTAWSATWRRTSTKARSLRQPAVASVNGDVTQIGMAYLNDMYEQALE